MPLQSRSEIAFLTFFHPVNMFVMETKTVATAVMKKIA